MRLKNIFTIIAAVVLSVQTGFAASQPKEANFNQIKESWELKADGSQVYHYRKELTLFTHTAMNETYGETFISYNPLYQELKINESYTIQTDGTKVKHPDNAFVEVLPKDAAKMPAYNHLKEMVVVHTGLELGATIVLDYTILTKAGYLPELDVCKHLQEFSPVSHYEMSFTYPAKKTAHYAFVAYQAEPEKTVNNGKETLTFQYEDLPAMPRDPGISLANGDIPCITFTTYASHAKAVKGVFAQFDTPKSLKALTAEVTAGKKDAKERMQAIHQYVMNEIEACPLRFNEAGYRLRSAQEVLASAYATEIEKVNLLYGMLKAAGLNATPAAAYTLDIHENDLGLAAARKWLVMVNLNKNTYYLDVLSNEPAAQSSKFLVTLNQGKRINLPDLTREINYKAHINLNQPEAIVTAQLSKAFLPNGEVSAFSLVDLNEKTMCEVNENGIKVEGKADVEVTKAGELSLITLPETRVALNEKNYASYNSERKHNLLLPYLYKEAYEYAIDIPADRTYNSKDVTVNVTKDCGNVSISIKKEGNQVLVKRSIQINKRVITPADYSDFRKLIVEWNDPHMRQVVLKRK